MFPLVAFPRLVDHYAPHFASVFSDDAFIQFKRYISGLIVSENKTIDGINRLFVHESRNQSSLNRLLTESPYSLPELNQCRLQVMNSLPGTQLKPRGVLGFDDTLLTHYGNHFEKIALLYDHTQDRWVWAHNLEYSEKSWGLLSCRPHPLKSTAVQLAESSQHGINIIGMPPSSLPLHTMMNYIIDATLHRTATNRITSNTILVIVHSFLLPLKISDTCRYIIGVYGWSRVYFF